MKTRIFIPGTIILIIIILLGFFIGCNVNSEPSAPGGSQALVGTWAQIEPGIIKDVYTFTLDTFVNPIYTWDVDTWVLFASWRGSLTISGELLTMTAKEISYDGSTWGAYGPEAMTFVYSISDNELTLKFGDAVWGVYTKQ